MKSDKSTATGSTPGLVALNKWAKEIGLHPVSLWRWRKAGMLQTVNIAGRQYISFEAIQKFLQRAESGEFSKTHVVPRRQAAVA